MTTRELVHEGEILLDAGLRDRLERLGAFMGVSSTMMASHAIERWVAEQERMLALIESFGAPVGGEMGSRLKEMLRTGLFAREQKIPGGPVLTEGEVGAIADQENLSRSAAAGLGSALLQSREGIREIERFIHESAARARAQGQSEKAKDLEGVLDGFKQAQPVRTGAG